MDPFGMVILHQGESGTRGRGAEKCFNIKPDTIVAGVNRSSVVLF